MKRVNVALALPWYKGPDDVTFPACIPLIAYFGKLDAYSSSEDKAFRYSVPLSDTDDLSEIWNIDAEVGELIHYRFILSAATNISLAGNAREMAVKQAIDMGADIIFSFDYDMIVRPADFARLLCDIAKKDSEVHVVAALAFTGRLPLAPVIYDATPFGNDGRVKFDARFKYERDKLQTADAFGTGTFMARATVFQKIPQPWFAVTGGMGEDIFFTGYRCHQFGIPVHVDTRAKVDHKPTLPARMHNEEMYLETMGADNVKA